MKFPRINFDLEQSLRPTATEGRPLWHRDGVAIGLLAMLAIMMLPGWPQNPERMFNDLIGQLTSVYLLPAMGFLLALRMGAVDLGVWVNMALGGIVAAKLINSGVSPAGAFCWAAAAGMLSGGLSAAITCLSRLPSPLVTAAMAALIMLGLQGFVGSRSVAIGSETFVGWHIAQSVKAPQQAPRGAKQPSPAAAAAATRPAEIGPASTQGSDAPAEVVVRGELSPPEHSAPLNVTRMLLVVGVYGLTLLGLLWGKMLLEPRVELTPRRLVAGSLVLSGMLAAVGGAFWLIESLRAPVPSGIIGDLRIPAAALLAGGAILAGPTRTLLSGALLAPALLMTVLWRQWAWNCCIGSWELHMLALVGMTVTAVIAARLMIRSPRPIERTLLLLAMALAGLAMVLSAATGRFPLPATQDLLAAASLIAWAVSATMLILAELVAWRGRSATR